MGEISRENLANGGKVISSLGHRTEHSDSYTIQAVNKATSNFVGAAIIFTSVSALIKFCSDNFGNNRGGRSNRY